MDVCGVHCQQLSCFVSLGRPNPASGDCAPPTASWRQDNCARDEAGTNLFAVVVLVLRQRAVAAARRCLQSARQDSVDSVRSRPPVFD